MFFVFTGLRKEKLLDSSSVTLILKRKDLTVLRSVSVNDATHQVEVSSPKASSYGTLSITDEVVCQLRHCCYIIVLLDH